MAGSLAIVGLGPGDPDLLTPEAARALAAATDLVGYGPYVARVPERPGQRRHVSDNRAELLRAGHALDLARQGRTVAVVSSGDPGVFAMASAVFEAIEHGAADWRAIDVTVMPGVSALLAAAARLGAPLGSDFCAISLSDNLKPWELVVRRIEAAAAADFVIALYNPASRARPWQLGAALDVLRAIHPPTVPVVFARAVRRPDEHVVVTELGAADAGQADMRTLVLVGSSTTRAIRRDGAAPWLYTPRSVAAQAS